GSDRTSTRRKRARRDSNPQPSDPKSKRGHHPAAPILHENQERRAVRCSRLFAYVGVERINLAAFGCTMAARRETSSLLRTSTSARPDLTRGTRVGLNSGEMLLRSIRK